MKYKAIVIGSSAGGLFAVEALIGRLPQDYPIPIILAQHRAADNKDLLEEVLQHKCDITVRQAEEKSTISSGIVYVAPPGYHLLIEEDNTFSLSTDEQVSLGRPSIDILFETAADVYKRSLVGIILTGANSDGAKGMAKIKKDGGVSIAQSPDEAQFAYMPQAAIDRGGVDHIWPLAKIHGFLNELATK